MQISISYSYIVSLYKQIGVELGFFKSNIKMIPFLPFPTLLIPKLKQYLQMQILNRKKYVKAVSNKRPFIKELLVVYPCTDRRERRNGKRGGDWAYSYILYLSLVCIQRNKHTISIDPSTSQKLDLIVKVISIYRNTKQLQPPTSMDQLLIFLDLFKSIYLFIKNT